MALGTEVVDLVRLHLLQDTGEVRTVRQVAVVQNEVLVLHMRVFVDVVHALRVEGRGAALDAMHFVALGQQELSEVRAVLAGDAGNQTSFRHKQLPT